MKNTRSFFQINKSKTHKMLNYRKYGFLASMALLIACSSPEETYEVQERELNEAVYASGQIMPDEYYFLQVNAPEKLMKLMVTEGTMADSGSLVAILGNPSENRQLENLSRQVSLAREMAGEQSAIFEELRIRTQQAEDRYLQDSMNAERNSRLAKEKAVSVIEAEQAMQQAQSSKADYISLRQQYAGRRNELNRNVLQSEQQLVQLQQSREGRILLSPMRGLVYQVYHREGSLVQPNEPVVLIGSPDSFRLEMLVDERDIRKVKLGQKIIFQTDLKPEVIFEARIVKIVPVLQLNTRSFEVEAEVFPTDATLYPQASVEANILVRENIKALVVPPTYILQGDTVLLHTEKENRKVPVRTGTRNDNWVEIQS